jgi:hypothetical protein
MSFSTDISITDKATPVLEAQLKKLSPRFVNRIAGRAGQNFVRDYLFKFNTSHPNKMGGDRTNFYAQAARGTTWASDEIKAVISINQVGIRQRWLGGEIKARKGKYLTIPARAEAYGKRAREFPDLTLVFIGGKPALVQANQTVLKDRVREKAEKVRKQKGLNSVTVEAGGLLHTLKQLRGAETGGAVYYWLVPSVVQRGDQNVMPPHEKLVAHVVQELSKAIAAKEKLAGGVQ